MTFILCLFVAMFLICYVFLAVATTSLGSPYDDAHVSVLRFK